MSSKGVATVKSSQGRLQQMNVSQLRPYLRPKDHKHDPEMNYVLDRARPATEIIVLDGPTCLRREGFWSLGLGEELESNIGNACFRLIEEEAQRNGMQVHVADLYAVPTWKQGEIRVPDKTPNGTNHYMICVLLVSEREALFLDSLCPSGFGDQVYKTRFRQLAQAIAPGPWVEKHGTDFTYAFCICTGAPFLFESSEVPAIRKWWCLQLMERFSIERQGRYFGQRFAYWTEEAKLLLGGSLPPFVRLKPIREQMQVPLLLAKRGLAARRMLLELEHKVIWKILVLVVVEDGDVAIWRLALTCKAFHHIVCQLHFRREAHFCWLDSVVDWRKRAPQQYRRPYTISVCSHLMCRSLYKDCGPGYRGKGKRGVLEAFYSSEDFPGCCSWDCFICDGGLD